MRFLSCALGPFLVDSFLRDGSAMKASCITLKILLLSGALAACSTIDGIEDVKNGQDEIKPWFPKQFSLEVSAAESVNEEYWWSSFSDDGLNFAIESALSQNYDLGSAVARLQQARAQFLIDNSRRFPALNLSSTLNIDAPADGIGTGLDEGGLRSAKLGQAGIGINYEFNVMGRDKFSAQAAYNRALASEYAREALFVSLIGEVATTYFEYAALKERVKVAERNLAVITTITEGLQTRLDRGDTTIVTVLQQKILQNNTSAEVNDLTLQREKAKNRLLSLLGRPISPLKIETVSLSKIEIPKIHPGLPSDLLCRRPDIKRAEALLVGAQLDLSAARANLFPSITLTSNLGLGSFELADVLSPESIFINASANLVQTIFDNGGRKAELTLATARNRELLSDYANTVVIALQEVEDSLDGVALTSRQYETLRVASDLAQQMLDISITSVERGGLDYLQLLEIQRTALLTQDREIVARFEQILATVDLVKALGGGLETSSLSRCVEDENTNAMIVVK